MLCNKRRKKKTTVISLLAPKESIEDACGQCSEVFFGIFSKCPCWLTNTKLFFREKSLLLRNILTTRQFVSHAVL